MGDRVWGVLGAASGFGSAAEYVTVPAERLGHVPEGIGMVEAASLPMGTTAVTALCDQAELRPGETLLVRGAAGGVGNIAVQLGVAHGAEVTGLTSADTLDFVRGLGAHHAFDHRTVTPADLGTFDVILDTVGSDTDAFRALLNPGGRMVTIAPDPKSGALPDTTAEGNGRLIFFMGDPKRALLEDLALCVNEGILRPVSSPPFRGLPPAKCRENPAGRLESTSRAVPAGLDRPTIPETYPPSASPAPRRSRRPP